MAQKNHEIENVNGETLHAVLELPLGQPPKAYAIFAHCFTCNSDLRAVRTITRELTNFGFGVMRFDFTGLGESDGSFADTNFTHNLKDLETVSNYMGENYRAPELIIGHSLGGAAAIIAASQLENIKAVAAIAAPADPQHVTHLFGDKKDVMEREGMAEVNIGGRPFMLKKQFLDDLKAQDSKSVLKNLRKPLLVMHAPQDKIVNIENAAIIYERAFHPKSFVSLDGADHLLSNQKDSTYVAKTIGTWAERYVLGDNSDDDLSPEEDQVVAQWIAGKGFTTQISNGRQTILADEPKKVGGDDLGFSPYELLTAALGACTAMTLKLYSERKKWPLEEVKVFVSHKKVHKTDSENCEDEKTKLDVYEKRIVLNGDLSEEQKNRLLEIAEKCPVNKTLLN
ncbi:MAG: alpha/beta fold hydrolase [Cryomorphaceae bacterium]|nr:alpha/beta fold hydrolase [Cryomorphaceae bacterium]